MALIYAIGKRYHQIFFPRRHAANLDHIDDITRAGDRFFPVKRRLEDVYKRQPMNSRHVRGALAATRRRFRRRCKGFLFALARVFIQGFRRRIDRVEYGLCLLYTSPCPPAGGR